MAEVRGPKTVSWEKEFEQDGDGNASLTSQHLVVRQEDCGGGPFYVIETERWAFDTLDELVEVLRKAGIPEKAGPQDEA